MLESLEMLESSLILLLGLNWFNCYDGGCLSPPRFFNVKKNPGWLELIDQKRNLILFSNKTEPEPTTSSISQA